MLWEVRTKTFRFSNIKWNLLRLLFLRQVWTTMAVWLIPWAYGWQSFLSAPCLPRCFSSLAISAAPKRSLPLQQWCRSRTYLSCRLIRRKRLWVPTYSPKEHVTHCKKNHPAEWFVPRPAGQRAQEVCSGWRRPPHHAECVWSIH